MSQFQIKYSGKARAIITDIVFSSALRVNGRAPAQPVVAKALWDSGADGSVISPRIAKALGLTSLGQATVESANGDYIAATYVIDLMLPNGIVIKGLQVMESDLKSCDALIGMDVITLGDMAITNNPTTQFTFRIPSEGEFSHDL